MDANVDRRLVIFGCGYVGSELARQAITRGWGVTALTRNLAKAEELRRLGIQTVVAELASTEWHAQIAGGADWVVNTVSAGGGGLDGYRRSYVDGMASILAWTRNVGTVGTISYTSSTSVYPQDGGAAVDEDAPTGGSERGEILREAERLLESEAGRGCERGVVLRLAGIYGPGRHYLLDQVRDGTVAGVGEHRLNLIHRDDVCGALWATQSGSGGTGRMDVFNVADDAPARKSEVVAWLARRLGVAMPEFTGLPIGLRRSVTPDRVILNTKLKSRSGWRPQFPDFRAGYENVLAGGAE